MVWFLRPSPVEVKVLLHRLAHSTPLAHGNSNGRSYFPKIRNNVQSKIRNREQTASSAHRDQSGFGFLPAQRPYRPNQINGNPNRRESGIVMSPGSPGEKESTKTHSHTVPILNSARLQQQQSAEPGRLNFAFRTRTEAQRQCLSTDCQEADGEQPAQFHRRWKRAVQDDRNRQQQQ